nr:phosphotransferase [Ruegeria arenilitoris]
MVAQLEAQGLVSSLVRFETLFGGRTNRVWKVLGGDNDAVLKLYRAPFDNPLFRNDAESEAKTLQALKCTGFVPKIRATGAFESSNWVLYDHAPGTPWQEGVQKVAQLLRTLHESRIKLDAPAGCNGTGDLEAHALRILAKCRTNSKSRMDRYKPKTYIAPTRDTRLIHGDPVPGNILVSSSGLTLIDWQCPAWGDPCEDLAIFLSPAMQYIYRGAPLTTAETDMFLTAYGQPKIAERYNALRAWFAWRMAAYCLWRIENGALDYSAGFDLEIATL